VLGASMLLLVATGAGRFSMMGSSASVRHGIAAPWSCRR
jgi:hypothetical protein